MIRKAEAAGRCPSCRFQRQVVGRALFWCWNCRKEFTSAAQMNPNTGRPIPGECPRCGAICRDVEKGGQ